VDFIHPTVLSSSGGESRHQRWFASIAAVIECKQQQVQAAKDKAEQAEKDQAMQDQINALRQEIEGRNANLDSIKKHQAGIQKGTDQLKVLVRHM